MHDVLNRAEQTLARSDRRGDVTTIRHLYQETMQADFTEAVERLTGHKVFLGFCYARLTDDATLVAEAFEIETLADASAETRSFIRTGITRSTPAEKTH